MALRRLDSRIILRHRAARALCAATRADEDASSAVRATLSSGFAPAAVDAARAAWQEAVERLAEAARTADCASEAAAGLSRLLTAPAPSRAHHLSVRADPPAPGPPRPPPLMPSQSPTAPNSSDALLIMKRQATPNPRPPCPIYGRLQRRHMRGRGRRRIRGHVGRRPRAPCGRGKAARPRHGRLIRTVALPTMFFRRIVASLENERSDDMCRKLDMLLRDSGLDCKDGDGKPVLQRHGMRRQIQRYVVLMRRARLIPRRDFPLWERSTTTS